MEETEALEANLKEAEEEIAELKAKIEELQETCTQHRDARFEYSADNSILQTRLEKADSRIDKLISCLLPSD